MSHLQHHSSHERRLACLYDTCGVHNFALEPDAHFLAKKSVFELFLSPFMAMIFRFLLLPVSQVLSQVIPCSSL
jgi:hypothetical protein